MVGEQIRYWIDNKGPFPEGVRLLKTAGRPAREYELWLGKPYIPAHVVDKLRRILSPLADHGQAATPPVGQKRRPADKKEPEAITRLREEGKKWLKKQAQRHSQLCYAKTDQDRYEIAKELMEVIIPRIDDLYDQIREYERSGAVPVAPPSQLVRETVAKMNRISSLRSSNSRAKGKLKKAKTDTDQQKLEKEIMNREAEIRQLEEELGTHQ